MDTLYSAVKEAADKFPNRDCIVFYGSRMTYKQFLNYVDTLCGNLIKMGIVPGDVVTVCLPNSPSAAVVLYAVNRLGAICSLAHPYIPINQLKENVADTQSKLLIIYDVYAKKNGFVDFSVPTLLSNSGFFMPLSKKVLFRISRTSPANKRYRRLEKLFFGSASDMPYYDFTNSQAAVYLPSGGTTGEPKTIMHNCNAFNIVCQNAQFFVADPVESYKAMYSVLPIFHGFGLCMTLHLSLVNGLTNVMSMRFNAKQMAKAIVCEEVGVIMGVPTMFKRLLTDKIFLKAKMPSLRECYVGGDTVPDSLVANFNAALKKSGSKGRLLCGYGLTETVSVCSVNTLNKFKDGSLGHPLPQTEFCIVKDGKLAKSGEEGEILVNCPMLTLGYKQKATGQPQSPVKQFNGKNWLFTGDYGHIDEDGFLYFKQRIKNIIKVNGVPIFPSEIEKTVNGIKGVAASCAVGIADEKRGEAVKLFIETVPKADKVEILEEIRSAVNSALIVYATPKEIVFMDKLPLNEIGKIDRKKLV